MFVDFVQRVLAERDTAQMELLEDHVVLGECAGLVCEQIRDAAELLGYGRRAHHRARYVFVSHYHHRIQRLCMPAISCVFAKKPCNLILTGHIKIDSQADRNDGREQQQESKERQIPLAIYSLHIHKQTTTNEKPLSLSLCYSATLLNVIDAERMINTPKSTFERRLSSKSSKPTLVEPIVVFMTLRVSAPV